jgi:mRNA interferase MazF
MCQEFSVAISLRWLTAVDPPGKGHEQHKKRPCVVVSPAAMHQTGMAVVCPMTSTIKPKWPYRLNVVVNGKSSDIMVDQIRAISLERFDAFIEVLRQDFSQKLKDIIARMYAV